MEQTTTDSYGNVYTNVIRLCSYDSSIIYNLNKKFNNFKFTLAMQEGENRSEIGVVIIKADDNVVYTSPTLPKNTEPLNMEIDISNCVILEIEYNGITDNTSVDGVIIDGIVLKK